MPVSTGHMSVKDSSPRHLANSIVALVFLRALSYKLNHHIKSVGLRFSPGYA